MEEGFGGFVGGEEGSCCEVSEGWTFPYTCLVDWTGFGCELTGWHGGQDDASNALVKPPKEGAVDGAICGVCVEAFVIWGLYPGFDSVEGVHEQIYGEGREGTSEKNIGMGISKGH